MDPIRQSELEKIYKSQKEKGIPQASDFAESKLVSQFSSDYSGLFGNRNKRKELILSMEGSQFLEDGALDSTPDWRDIKNNHICDVDHSIGLFTKDIEISPKLEIPFKEAKDFVSWLEESIGKIQKTKMSFDAISTLAAIKGSKGTLPGEKPKHDWGNSFQSIVRKISKLSGFNAEEFKSLFDSITFKVEFSFGQFGLFDARKEVVEPICALMGIIAPNYSKGDDAGLAMYSIPYPTANQLIGFNIDGLLAKDLKTFDDALAAKDGAEGATDKAKGAVDSLGSAILKTDQFLENILVKGFAGIVNNRAGYNNGQFRFANFRYGTVKIGPCIINSIDGDFDFTKLDENGYPFKGTATIQASDLRTANSNVIRSLFVNYVDYDNYIGGSGGSTDGGSLSSSRSSRMTGAIG